MVWKFNFKTQKNNKIKNQAQQKETIDSEDCRSHTQVLFLMSKNIKDERQTMTFLSDKLHLSQHFYHGKHQQNPTVIKVQEQQTINMFD